MFTIESLNAFLSKHDRPGLALDIDDTLSVTGPLWFQSMKEIAGDPGVSYEEASEMYSGRYQTIPAWKDHPGIEAWIQKTLGDHEYYLDLEVIEHARHLVHEIHLHVPIHAYITMRPTTVVESSRAWLAKNGFPDLPVLAKPADLPKEKMHLWKAQALTELYPKLLGIVDDDPHVIDHLPSDYKGTVFLFGKASHPRKDLNIIPCKDWNEVYSQVQDFSKQS